MKVPVVRMTAGAESSKRKSAKLTSRHSGPGVFCLSFEL